jgi:3-dehydroquinate dehydratase/shikimate dehydrogenase
VIVAVVAPRSRAEAREAIGRIEASSRGAGAIELRLDELVDLTGLEALVPGLPWIASCRRPADGGRFEGPESERARRLEAALYAGAAHVDVELDAEEAFGFVPPARMLLSVHAQDRVPHEVGPALRALLGRPAALVKAAVAVRGLQDILDLGDWARAAAGRAVAIGLGSAGLVTRALHEAVPSAWTYAEAARPPGARPLAPGLPTLAELRGYRPGDAPPALRFGVLTADARGSLGPLFFGRLFRELGLDATYLPLETRDLRGLRAFLDRFGFRGVSVTMPHKVAALAVADHATPIARAVGAANTLVLEGGRWIADNTDVEGVREPLRSCGLPLAGRPALVIGAGGAARAAILALKELGCATFVRARRGAAELAEELGVLVDGPRAPEPSVLVQATPLGGRAAPDACPVDEASLRGVEVVFDLVYRAGETPLVAMARRAGARVLDGHAMYRVQARAQLCRFLPGVQVVDSQLAEAHEWAIAVQASS